jgi:hypothetical protein
MRALPEYISAKSIRHFVKLSGAKDFRPALFFANRDRCESDSQLAKAITELPECRFERPIEDFWLMTFRATGGFL